MLPPDPAWYSSPAIEIEVYGALSLSLELIIKLVCGLRAVAMQGWYVYLDGITVFPRYVDEIWSIIWTRIVKRMEHSTRGCNLPIQAALFLDLQW